MYMSKEKALKIYIECVDELYRNSSPSITWDEINIQYSGKPRDEFYMKHVIEEKLYNNIVDKYRCMLTPSFIEGFQWFLLDYAPTTKEE